MRSATRHSFPAPATAPATYWEARASRFAGEGQGLRAVCSYGMPWFYNQAIHLTQLAALAPWLAVRPGSRVLDVGCGVGRWTLRLAAAGADVTGVDISPTMLEEARERSKEAGVGERCRFVLSDLAALDLERRFDRIVGVTVLQHLLRREDLVEAIARLRAHLSPTGSLVLLEAMPTKRNRRCETPVFTARSWGEYRELFEAAGLRVAALSGVDPAPFKILYLPLYRRLPQPLADLGLACLTALGLPIDLGLGRRLTDRSWHKLVVLEHAD